VFEQLLGAEMMNFLKRRKHLPTYYSPRLLSPVHDFIYLILQILFQLPLSNHKEEMRDVHSLSHFPFPILSKAHGFVQPRVLDVVTPKLANVAKEQAYHLIAESPV
jgi:hypothetical protein